MPGVIKTDFYIAVDEPDGTTPRYRYITEAWSETMEELEAAFLPQMCRHNWPKTASVSPIACF